jgi:hypothetical protein
MKTVLAAMPSTQQPDQKWVAISDSATEQVTPSVFWNHCPV